MPTRKPVAGKGLYMISAVAQKYNIHPQTLRLYEREGLLRPSRTEGNTRLYSDEDLEQLETILALTRDLGVNLAGVEIVMNMRKKMEQMQKEVNEFMQYVKRELQHGLGSWEQRLSSALVPAPIAARHEDTPAGDLFLMLHRHRRDGFPRVGCPHLAQSVVSVIGDGGRRRRLRLPGRARR